MGGVSYENQHFRFEPRVEVFDIRTHEVSFSTSLPAPTRVNTSVFHQGSIYVFGGAYPGVKNLEVTAIAVKYDIDTGVWSRVADMPTAKTTKAVVKDDWIYVVGGYDHNKALDVFERYNPKTNQWQTLPPLPKAISAHSVTLVNDKLYTFGDYKNLSITYQYSFKKRQWQEVDIGFIASRHNASTTLNKHTYVIGGNTGTKGPFLDYIQTFKL